MARSRSFSALHRASARQAELLAALGARVICADKKGPSR
jgi:hypothetical protein